MKTWLTPTAVENKFIPNEAVSTCYAVACNCSKANEYERRLGLEGEYGTNWQGLGYVYHKEKDCGTASHQHLTVEKGNLTYLKEGNLNAQLYSDSKYEDPVKTLPIKEGQTIYWTTAMSQPTRTWHHQGKIIKAVDSKSMS